jgi:photosystem II stability/assembly factor-like uncharacterized protein
MSFPITALALLVSYRLAALASAAEAWSPLGPSGGDVRSLAADPRDPRIVYLGTADGVLYRSDDAGVRWERLLPGFPSRGMSLDDLVTDRDGALYVAYWEVHGSGGGVARSRDGGRTFMVLEGIAGQGVRALAQAAGDPRVLVAGTLTGVFRSDDGGDTWTRISPEGHEEIRNVNSVAVDPRDPRVVYIGTWHLPWKTTDAGHTWRPVKAGMIDDSDVMTLNLDHRDPDHVFATACSGIYRSANAGASWSRVRGIPSSSRRTRAFAQPKDRPETLFAGTTEGLWRSDDGSATWRLLSGKDLVVNAVLPLPAGPLTSGVVLAGTEGAGVLRSRDGGLTFTASNEGFSSRFIAGLAVGRSGRVLAAVGHDRRHGGVFTQGSGGGWVPLGTGLEGREVLSIAAAGVGGDEVALAGTDDGVFLNAMHCGFWRRLPTRVEGNEVHPRATRLAAATDRLLAAATPGGLLLSRDGGERWERRRLGLAGEVTAVAYSDRPPYRLAAATPLGVFVSDDEGRTFVQVSNGVAGAAIRSLAFLPGDPRVLFATTPVGLLRSEDAGHTWTRQGGGLPLSDITGLAFADGGRRVFASDFRRGSVFSSLDAGLTWAPLSTEGLVGEQVFTLAADGGGRVLAGTMAGGVRAFMAGPATGTAKVGSE